MTDQFDPSRHPRDIAGKFAEKRAGDPGGDVLGGAAISGPSRHGDLMQLDTDALWPLVNGTVEERVVAARSLNLSEEQAAVLSDASQPFPVRFAMVSRCEDTSVAAATDPDPVIRAHVLANGVGLRPDTADRLAQDPDVQHAARVFGLVSAPVLERNSEEA